MALFNALQTADAEQQQHTGWEGTEHYTKEERQLQPTRRIVLKGAVDIVFIRSEHQQLVVAGEDMDAVRSVKTHYKGDKLVIEREGMSFGATTINVQRGNISINISGAHIGQINMGGGGANMRMGAGGRAIVGIALPIAPDVSIQGSGSVTLQGLQQAALELKISGSGDIKALGQVRNVEAEISGSGSVDVSQLLADSADLSVSGSGDIEAHARAAVVARVAGSGSIVVYGNPSARDSNVAGSGKIKFR